MQNVQNEIKLFLYCFYIEVYSENAHFAQAIIEICGRWVGLQKMKKTIVILLVLCLIVCAVPVWMAIQANGAEKTILDTETVEVVARGRFLWVTDKGGGNRYEFRVVRVRCSDADMEPVTMVSTPSFMVQAIRGGVVIRTQEKVYIITMKRGGLWNAEKG